MESNVIRAPLSVSERCEIPVEAWWLLNERTINQRGADDSARTLLARVPAHPVCWAKATCRGARSAGVRDWSIETQNLYRASRHPSSACINVQLSLVATTTVAAPALSTLGARAKRANKHANVPATSMMLGARIVAGCTLATQLGMTFTVDRRESRPIERDFFDVACHSSDFVLWHRDAVHCKTNRIS